MRQHWKLVVITAVFVIAAVTAFAHVPIRPIITGSASVITSPITENIAGTVDLFDSSVGHEIDVRINPAEYQDMIDTYRKEGEKDWANAQVTIDGTLITDVAVRLKGNSTLMSLRDGGRGFPPAGADLPEGMAGMAPEGMAEMAEMMPQLDADDPSSLPLLLSFDEYVEGRAYQGRTELSVRAGSPVLNEAVALTITAETGQPTQCYGYVVYSVNDSSTKTRLVVEHPDESYADSLFDGDGVLYKMTADSDFRYQGDDQTTYAEQFVQINGAGSFDLQPVIAFLRWLDAADDAEFDAELDTWVDTESFARYLATQNLLSNFDDIAGPGRNGYLRYDLSTRKISIVSWDLNGTFMTDSTAGPHDTIDLGAMMGRTAPGGDPGPGAGAAPDRMRTGNTLKSRYLESDRFEEQYLTAYRSLYRDLYANERVIDIVGEVADTVPVSDGSTRDAIDEAASKLVDRLAERVKAFVLDPP